MDWCRACGARPPADATFCPACGVRLPVDGAQRSLEAALLGQAAPQTRTTLAQQGTTTHAHVPGPQHQEPLAPRGWYPDPQGTAPSRWWTGEDWSHVVNDRSEDVPRVDTGWSYVVPADWLPDHLGRAPWRWWDGVEFTDHLSEGTTMWREGSARVVW